MTPPIAIGGVFVWAKVFPITTARNLTTDCDGNAIKVQAGRTQVSPDMVAKSYMDIIAAVDAGFAAQTTLPTTLFGFPGYGSVRRVPDQSNETRLAALEAMVARRREKS